MAEPIRFYFDFNSTFSYIAIHSIDTLAARFHRSVDWRVLSLGHLFQAQGIAPPPTIPTKLKYLSIDFARSCAFANLPCKMPPSFPPDVKLARFMFCHLKQKDERASHVFAKTVSMAVFGHGAEVATPAQLAAVCQGLPGVSVADIEAAAADPKAKSALVASLDAAVADGMVGAPFFVLDGEPFWGADRLGQLERRLEERA